MQPLVLTTDTTPSTDFHVCCFSRADGGWTDTLMLLPFSPLCWVNRPKWSLLFQMFRGGGNFYFLNGCRSVKITLGLTGMKRPINISWNSRLSAKLVPNFADRGCRVVSVTDPYGRILCLLDRSRYFFFQVAPQLYSLGWVDPVPDTLFLRKSGSAGNRTRTSGTVTTRLQRRSIWTSWSLIKFKGRWYSCVFQNVRFN
jgi:hypothetical protein